MFWECFEVISYILKVWCDEDDVVDPALSAVIEQLGQRVAVTHVDVLRVNTNRHCADADVTCNVLVGNTTDGLNDVDSVCVTKTQCAMTSGHRVRHVVHAYP